MTRIDLTTREWHDLLKPVLPHACTDAEVPEICVVRLEGRDRIVYAVATDRYTLAATRHRLDGPCEDFVVTIDRADAAAMLRLFTYGKDYDPQLRITVGPVHVPIGGGPAGDGTGFLFTCPAGPDG
jgi:DNA polymerase III sliding clamp (beta) subunit (PCNA family)